MHTHPTPDNPPKTEKDWLTYAWYTVCLGVALFGAATGVNELWNVPLEISWPGTIGLELGGVVTYRYVQKRRALGESVNFARVMSAAIAGAAIAVNIAGHNDGLGLWYALFSLLGYITFVQKSEAARRDALRAATRMADLPPIFSLWQWTRHPRLTAAARTIARDNRLDPAEGLKLARRQRDQRRRARKLHPLMRDLIARRAAETVDQQTGAGKKDKKARKRDATRAAKIATTLMPLADVSLALAQRGDVQGLVELVAKELPGEIILAREVAGNPESVATQPPLVVAATVGVAQPQPAGNQVAAATGNQDATATSNQVAPATTQPPVAATGNQVATREATRNRVAPATSRNPVAATNARATATARVTATRNPVAARPATTIPSNLVARAQANAQEVRTGGGTVKAAMRAYLETLVAEEVPLDLITAGDMATAATLPGQPTISRQGAKKNRDSILADLALEEVATVVDSVVVSETTSNQGGNQ